MPSGSTHTGYTISFRMWAIDSWDREWARLYVDNVLIWQKQRAHYNDCRGWTLYRGSHHDPWGGQRNQRCYADGRVTRNHRASSMTLQFYANLNSNNDDESWYFNRVRIQLNGVAASRGCTYGRRSYRQGQTRRGSCPRGYTGGYTYTCNNGSWRRSGSC